MGGCGGGHTLPNDRARAQFAWNCRRASVRATLVSIMAIRMVSGSPGQVLPLDRVEPPAGHTEAWGVFGAVLLFHDLDPNAPNDELVIGQPGVMSWTSPNFGGRVWVFNRTHPSSPRKIDLSSAGFSEFGAALAVGDVNGDLAPDLVVGEPRWVNTSNGVREGRVHVFFGPWNLSSPTDIFSGSGIFMTGHALCEGRFGQSVACADLDGLLFGGDSFAEILVGAPNCTGQTGEAWILETIGPTSKKRLTSLSPAQGGACQQ